MTVKDFELALFQLLSPAAKSTFQKLDSESAFDLNKDEGQARVDPAEEPNELRWTLSQWRDLRESNGQIQDVMNNEILMGHNESAVPEEIATLQTLFPGFYSSIPDNHLN